MASQTQINRRRTIKLRSTLESRYYCELSDLALSRFKWTGYGQGINRLWLERYLLEYGVVYMGYCAELDQHIVLPGTEQEDRDIYGEGKDVIMRGWGGWTGRFSTKNMIKIRATPSEVPLKQSIIGYAQILANIDLIIMSNIEQQKMPSVYYTTKEMQKTINEAYNLTREGVPAIIADDSLRHGDKLLEVLNPGAPYVADKMHSLKNKYLHEFLTSWGINNANTDKKEREITPEAESNNQLIAQFAKSKLYCRQQGAEEYNERWKQNCKVTLRSLTPGDDPGNMEMVLDIVDRLKTVGGGVDIGGLDGNTR